MYLCIVLPFLVDRSGNLRWGGQEITEGGMVVMLGCPGGVRRKSGCDVGVVRGCQKVVWMWCWSGQRV